MEDPWNSTLLGSATGSKPVKGGRKNLMQNIIGFYDNYKLDLFSIDI